MTAGVDDRKRKKEKNKKKKKEELRPVRVREGRTWPPSHLPRTVMSA